MNTNKNIINKYFKYSIWIIILIYFPILIIDDSFIKSSSYLIEFSNLFSSIFPNIENNAIKAGHYDLYNKMKLVLTMNIFLIILTFITFFSVLGKIYLCSLGLLKCSNSFIIKNIQDNNINFKDTLFILSFSLFLFFAIRSKYLGELNTSYSDTFTSSLIYGNSITLVAYGISGYLFVVFFVVSILNIFVILYLKLRSRGN